MGLDKIPWSQDYVKDIIKQLKQLELDYIDNPNLDGRWDNIIAGTTVNASVANDPIGIMSNTFDSGQNTHTLTIDIQKASQFNSYSDFKAYIQNLGTGMNKDMVSTNVSDMINHEFGHRLTTPHVNPDFIENFATDVLNGDAEDLLKGISLNATLDGDEALAEIFAAYKKGLLTEDNPDIDDLESIIDFFNTNCSLIQL